MIRAGAKEVVILSIMITGVCGEVGRTLCNLLFAESRQVFGFDIDASIHTLFESNALFYGYHGDITRPESLEAFSRELAPIEHVVLLAGGASQSEIKITDPLGITDDVFNDSVSTNLSAQYSCIRTFFEPLKRHAAVNKSLTLVSSINSLGNFGFPAYSSAKAGLNGLVGALAPTLGSFGIRINAVLFGTILNERAILLHGDQENHFDDAIALSVLGRLLTPIQAARTLLSVMDDLDAMTGASLIVDNGQSIRGEEVR